MEPDIVSAFLGGASRRGDVLAFYFPVADEGEEVSVVGEVTEVGKGWVQVQSTEEYADNPVFINLRNVTRIENRR